MPRSGENENNAALRVGPGSSGRLGSAGIALFAIFIIAHPWLALDQSNRLLLHLLLVAVVLLLLLIRPGIMETFTFQLSSIDRTWLISYSVIMIFIIASGVVAYRYHIFIYTVGLAFLLASRANKEQYKPAYILLFLGALLYASASVIQYFYTDFFNQFIFQFAQAELGNHITIMVNANYYPGLGFSQPAVAAGYMVIGLGLLFAFWSGSNIRLVPVKVALFLLLFSGIMLTGKRSILIWAACALIFSYLVQGGLGQIRRRTLKLLPVIMIIILLFFILVQLLGILPFTERLAYMFYFLQTGESIESMEVRFSLYREAWQMFLDNPILGVGWGQFRYLTTGDYLMEYNVHNVYLQLLAETGIFGFLVIAGSLLFPFIITLFALNRCIRVGCTTTGNAEFANNAISGQPKNTGDLFGSFNSWAGALSFALYYQAFFLLYSLSENPFYHLSYVLLYFLVLSIVSSYLVFGEKQFINLDIYSLFKGVRSRWMQ